MRILFAAMAVLLGWIAPAGAGGYVSVGMGSEASLDGDISEHFSTEDLTMGRVAVGQRMGLVAVEVVMFGADLQGISSYVRGESSTEPDFSTMSLGMDLKLHLGLRGPLEGYGRAGLNRTWLTTRDNTESSLDYAGYGYDVGLGLQCVLRFIPKVSSAVWVDYSRQVLDLSDPTGPTMSGEADMLTFGVSVGSL